VQPNLPVPDMQESENGYSGNVIEITRKFSNNRIFKSALTNRRKQRVHFT
jgi:hypothetical protein